MSTMTNDTKEVFRKKGACSHTLFFLLNREFGSSNEVGEKASNMLAGGLLNRGCQCGMLWGASLAAGSEASRRFETIELATAQAITATQQLLRSFCDRTTSVNCKDVTGYDLSNGIGMTMYIVKTFLGGVSNSTCFNLAEKWVPDAIDTARQSLSSSKPEFSLKPISCASEVAGRMGANREEMISVAGFAGGLGLSGEGCGALAAAVWMKMMAWCKDNPGKSPPYFNNKITKSILKTFYKETGSEIVCSKICGRKFCTLDEHTEFIQNGGCEKLIDTLAQS